MKKNKSLSNFEMHNSSVSSKNAIHKRTKDEEAIYAETSEKIKRGLGKATASTGTPIASLKGGAKYMTQLSNVGGGSVKIGGGGIKEGFNTFAKNHMAKGALGSKNLLFTQWGILSLTLLSYTNMKDSTQKALRKPRSK